MSMYTFWFLIGQICIQFMWTGFEFAEFNPTRSWMHLMMGIGGIVALWMG